MYYWLVYEMEAKKPANGRNKCPFLTSFGPPKIGMVRAIVM